MSRDFWILTFFGVLSVIILISIGVKHKENLRPLFAVAIAADFYSVVGNNIGIMLGFWHHPVRPLPNVFFTSVVYDMLFFPSTIVWYLVAMPRTLEWKLIYSLLWAGVLAMLEYWLEKTSDLIAYGRGWSSGKTMLMYLVTYFIFYWVYHWQMRRSPGDEPGEENSSFLKGKNRV